MNTYESRQPRLEPRLIFGPYMLVPARDMRGIREGYWMLPAVKHPATGVWYSPVIDIEQVMARAVRLQFTVEIINVPVTE